MPALTHKSRVKETASNKPNASTAFNLPDSAATGYQSFDTAYNTNDVVPYFASNGTNWESGIGTFTSDTPDTLARTQVLESSSGSAIDWSAGASVDVWVDLPAKLSQSYEHKSNISGLVLSWNSGTSITISTGKAYIESLGRTISIDSASTLSGLSLSASTWYDVYIYDNAGTTTCEINTTAPTATPFYGTAKSKTSDASRRFLGALKTNASSNLYEFLSITKGNFIEIIYKNVDCSTAPFRIVSGGTKSTTMTQAVFTPIGPPNITESVLCMLVLSASAGSGAASLVISLGNGATRLAFIGGYVVASPSTYACNTMWLPVNLATTDFYYRNESGDVAGLVWFLDTSGFGLSR
jgi:hypothetical protein